MALTKCFCNAKATEETAFQWIAIVLGVHTHEWEQECYNRSRQNNTYSEWWITLSARQRELPQWLNINPLHSPLRIWVIRDSFSILPSFLVNWPWFTHPQRIIGLVCFVDTHFLHSDVNFQVYVGSRRLHLFLTGSLTLIRGRLSERRTLRVRWFNLLSLINVNGCGCWEGKVVYFDYDHWVAFLGHSGRCCGHLWSHRRGWPIGQGEQCLPCGCDTCASCRYS